MTILFIEWTDVPVTCLAFGFSLLLSQARQASLLVICSWPNWGWYSIFGATVIYASFFWNTKNIIGIDENGLDIAGSCIPIIPVIYFPPIILEG